MIKCLVKECNANVNGESSVVVGLASGRSSKGLRVFEHPLALICPIQSYFLCSFLNNKTSQSFKQGELIKRPNGPWPLAFGLRPYKKNNGKPRS